MIWSRRALVSTVLLASSAALGLLAADRVDQIAAHNAARADLWQYTSRLQRNAAEVDRQSEAALNAVLNDHLRFCSPEEITFMQGIVFDSSEIKDIGRLNGNLFSCSSESGLFPRPYVVRPPDRTFRNISIYAGITLKIGAHAKGFVVQLRSANVVLNPRAFDELREPGRTFAAYLYDSPTGALVQGFGDSLPLSSAEVIASHSIEKSGVLYDPVCTASAHTCVVAAEPLSAVIGARRPLRALLLFFGGTLGFLIALSGMLLYRRHRSQERQLRRAIANGSFTLVYQPIVDLANGDTVAAEALLRWTNEDGDHVGPDVFIALAEEKGLIKAITRMVVDTVLAEMAPLMRDGNFRVTLNVTAEDLADAHFIDYLQNCLAIHHVPASALGLELRESTTNADPAFISNIAHLRRAGHVIYLDDFGTGYSSLAYLRDLAVDAIKIDRSFTASVGTHAVTESILPQILVMADQLNLDAVVEGVETAEQAAYFKGCAQKIWGQGWFFGRPVPARDFIAALEDDQARIATLPA